LSHFFNALQNCTTRSASHNDENKLSLLFSALNTQIYNIIHLESSGQFHQATLYHKWGELSDSLRQFYRKKQAARRVV